MGNWLLRADIAFGEEGDSVAMAALRGLIASTAGARVIRLVQQSRRTPQQAQAEQEDEDEDDDDDDEEFYSYWGSALGLPHAGDGWYPKVTEPQPAGVKLLGGGDFGKPKNRLGTPGNSNIYSRLRRMALQTRITNAADLKHNLIPNTHGTTVAAYYSNIYVAQFSPGASHGTLALP